MCRPWFIAWCLRAVGAAASFRFAFSPAAGAFCAGACAVAGGLPDGAFGLLVLVFGVCAQTGAAINAANATPHNRRFIVSTSEDGGHPTNCSQSWKRRAEAVRSTVDRLFCFSRR